MQAIQAQSPEGSVFPESDNRAAVAHEIIGEVATDSGNHKAFTLSHAVIPGTARVYLNGIRQVVKLGYDCTIDGDTIVFSDTVDPAPLVLVDYRFYK